MATKNWDGNNRADQPNTAFGKGYDARMSHMQANESGANAWLSDAADNTHIKLTVNVVQTDFALAGSEGQSPLQKDFYPRNFQQVAFTLACQARSQHDAGRIAEFVHKAQRNAISKGSLMGLVIPEGGLKHTQATSTLR